MTERWLTTAECAECINRAIRMDKAIGPWYIRDAIRRGELVARIWHEPGVFRKRAKFRIAPDDFEVFVRQTSPELAPRVIDEVRAMLPPAA